MKRLAAAKWKRAMTTFAILVCFIFRQDSAWAGPLQNINTVFLIVLENENWSAIAGNTNAPFINGTVLPMASYCGQYYSPPGNHPSEPNYLWLEAGTNFGISDDGPPSINSQNTTAHLTTLLNDAGISWKAYDEDIDGSFLPLTNMGGLYAAKHDPFVYFDDVTGTNDLQYAYGLAHIRPYSELAGDLESNTVAAYNFITPNLCDDGHDCGLAVSDTWLSLQLPVIMNSAAYTNNGAIFITWDEGEDQTDGPIGMIVMSPLARGNGYVNYTYHDHSAMLRTLQEIFGVTPFLGAAAQSDDLGDLFGMEPWLKTLGNATNGFSFSVFGVSKGQSVVALQSSNLVSWAPFATNACQTNFVVFTDNPAGAGARYFRAEIAR